MLQDIDTNTHAQWLRLQRALEQQATDSRRAQARLIPRLAYGTAILVAAIIGGYFYFTPGSSSRDTFITERGQQTRLILQDSSEVTLNYATELVVQKLKPDKPRLLSLKGEAYFRVRHNETPFIVSTDVAEVQVVGTEFNLRSRDGLLEVAVTKGIVRVTASRDGRDSSLTLTQNEMAVVAQNDFPGRRGIIPSPEYPGWMEGELFFNRTAFEAACREIEMRFDVTIKFEDGNVKQEAVTGVLHAGNADSALTALCGLTGRRFKHNGNEYFIY
ncbi:MAG: FecR domain-containing protein [Bacteroidetes bacterium]|nr:FecR domain-containing protein [Bacteroidota bacterium]MCW5895037.1 FecR domain-containing protein [Bacteroidota bacterium]